MLEESDKKRKHDEEDDIVTKLSKPTTPYYEEDEFYIRDEYGKKPDETIIEEDESLLKEDGGVESTHIFNGKLILKTLDSELKELEDMEESLKKSGYHDISHYINDLMLHNSKTNMPPLHIREEEDDDEPLFHGSGAGIEHDMLIFTSTPPVGLPGPAVGRGSHIFAKPGRDYIRKDGRLKDGDKTYQPGWVARYMKNKIALSRDLDYQFYVVLAGAIGSDVSSIIEPVDVKAEVTRLRLFIEQASAKIRTQMQAINELEREDIRLKGLEVKNILEINTTQLKIDTLTLNEIKIMSSDYFQIYANVKMRELILVINDVIVKYEIVIDSFLEKAGVDKDYDTKSLITKFTKGEFNTGLIVNALNRLIQSFMKGSDTIALDHIYNMMLPIQERSKDFHGSVIDYLGNIKNYYEDDKSHILRLVSKASTEKDLAETPIESLLLFLKICALDMVVISMFNSKRTQEKDDDIKVSLVDATTIFTMISRDNVNFRKIKMLLLKLTKDSNRVGNIIRKRMEKREVTIGQKLDTLELKTLYRQPTSIESVASFKNMLDNESLKRTEKMRQLLNEKDSITKQLLIVDSKLVEYRKKLDTPDAAIMEYNHDIQWALKPEVSGYMIINDTVVSAVERSYHELRIKFPWWWKDSVIGRPTMDDFRRDPIMRTHFSSYVSVILSNTRLTYPTRWFSSITPSIIRRNYRASLEILMRLEWAGTEFKYKKLEMKEPPTLTGIVSGWTDMLSKII